MSNPPSPDPSSVPHAAPPAAQRRPEIDRHPGAMPMQLPASPIGELVLPGSGRRVWWTGRVAIGLRYEGRPPGDAASKGTQGVHGPLTDASARRSPPR